MKLEEKCKVLYKPYTYLAAAEDCTLLHIGLYVGMLKHRNFYCPSN